MKAVIQRVNKACVKIDSKKISEIEKGLVVLLGVSCDDTEQDINLMVEKIKNLRIFQDAQGKTNISIKDKNGEVLIVSQFTLLADLEKGRRPSFTNAALPQKAEDFYNQVIKYLSNAGVKVKSGKFKEYMQVELINDGPVTLIYDTKERNKS
ncbi:MAG: D-aminoacyl-tRNA deacylase [Candidatus Omnitrophota bacterium]